MKVGETGEAFFVFETDKDVPEELQTSPLASPVPDPEDEAPGVSCYLWEEKEIPLTDSERA